VQVDTEWAWESIHNLYSQGWQQDQSNAREIPLGLATRYHAMIEALWSHDRVSGAHFELVQYFWQFGEQLNSR
jgi:hypothetical protein